MYDQFGKDGQNSRSGGFDFNDLFRGNPFAGMHNHNQRNREHIPDLTVGVSVTLRELYNGKNG